MRLFVSRAGADVDLSWSGAASPWRVERGDDPRGPWSVLDAARAPADLADPDAGSGVRLRFYGVW